MWITKRSTTLVSLGWLAWRDSDDGGGGGGDDVGGGEGVVMSS